MPMSMDAPFAKTEIAGELYCPHCGCRLFSWEDGAISKCEHLVFAYGWGDPDMFLAVRAEYAEAFLHALLGSPAYQNCVVEDEMEPISEDNQLVFCQADFSPEDRISGLIAAYCQGFPENLFPSLLSQSTVIFTDDRLYSGVHIAVDLCERFESPAAADGENAAVEP